MPHEKDSAGTPRIHAQRPSEFGGPVKRPPWVAVTVSFEKVSRDSAHSINSINHCFGGQSRTPVSWVPPQGDMPEVASTDIAWHSATQTNRSPIGQQQQSHSIKRQSAICGLQRAAARQQPLARRGIWPCWLRRFVRVPPVRPARLIEPAKGKGARNRRGRDPHQRALHAHGEPARATR